jgi:hypothetical protein
MPRTNYWRGLTPHLKNVLQECCIEADPGVQTSILRLIRDHGYTPSGIRELFRRQGAKPGDAAWTAMESVLDRYQREAN